MRNIGVSAVFAGVLVACALALPLSGRPQSANENPSGMVLIPAGEFWMGRIYLSLVDELGWNERDRLDDRPAHIAYLDAFYIDTHETTNEDYARFIQATGRQAPFHWRGGKAPVGKERFPIYNVSWDDAEAYCKWSGKRLPTEAEWERAARGGMDKKIYPWGDRFLAQRTAGSAGAAAENVKVAHTGFPNGPTAVGSYPPNAFGLYDVVGNVWEWVGDWYERDYYSVSPERNPPGPAAGVYRVFRGGGWSDTDERNLTVHYRNYTEASMRASTIGVRCAKSASALVAH